MKRKSKKNKKNIFKRLLSAFLLCIIPFTFVGCMGDNDPDEEFDPESSFIGNLMSVDMYGSKVLYRPDEYDYSGNTGGTDEVENLYYDQYGYQLLDYLYGVYIIPNAVYYTNIGKAFSFTQEEATEKNEPYLLPYMYDSSRYSITQVEEIVDTNGDVTSVKITADTNYAWKWSFDKFEDNSSTIFKAFFTSQFADSVNGNQFTFNMLLSDVNSDIQSYYNDTANLSTTYRSQFVSSLDQPEKYEAYSDYAKTLSYVIYRYALDLEPEEVTVEKYRAPVNNKYVKISIGDNNKTPDEALEEAKALFKKLGSFVGLVNRQIRNIKTWVLENVIGDAALSANADKITFITAKRDASGNVVLGDNGEVLYVSTPDNYGRDYGEKDVYTSAKDVENNSGVQDTLDKIITKANTMVSIGKNTDDSNVDIDDRFLASEVKEYAGTMFLITDDRNFAREGSQKPTSIPALEYQSVTIMLKNKMRMDSIWVALKYDNDGKGENSNEYIEMIVDLNYYNHTTGKYYTISSPILQVYDKDYDIDYLCFSEDVAQGEDRVSGHSSGYVFDALGKHFEGEEHQGDRYASVGAFNTGVGNGILMTDVGQAGYNGSPAISQTPLVLNGNDSLRTWYEIVEPQSLIDGKTYTTGRLDHTKFAGADGCDYLEICYRVLKEPGNSEKNYKFYTGIAAVIDG